VTVPLRAVINAYSFGCGFPATCRRVDVVEPRLYRDSISGFQTVLAGMTNTGRDYLAWAAILVSPWLGDPGMAVDPIHIVAR
jgi:hypothetical protein